VFGLILVLSCFLIVVFQYLKLFYAPKQNFISTLYGILIYRVVMSITHCIYALILNEWSAEFYLGGQTTVTMLDEFP
jgi:hypothetical protein